MKPILLSSLLLFGTMGLKAQSTESDAPAPMGNKILYVAPLSVTNRSVGFGVGFEGNIDKAGFIAYNLPLSIGFDMHTNNSYDYPGIHRPTNFLGSFMPGIKFYPAGNKGKVKYAIGPSLIAGMGRVTELTPIFFCSTYYCGDQIGTTQEFNPYTTRTRRFLGTMLNNSLTVSPTNHLVLGFDFGVGYTLVNRLDKVSAGNQMMYQGGFRMGYRF